MLHKGWEQEAVMVKLKRAENFGQMWALFTVTLVSYFRHGDKRVDDSQNAPPQSPSGTNISCLLFCPSSGKNTVSPSLAKSNLGRVEMRKVNRRQQRGSAICLALDLNIQTKLPGLGVWLQNSE